MEKTKEGKKLYEYQINDLNRIEERFENCPSDYNLLYQLPTGGGKTVVFSEITRRYIKSKNKKVLILTHRIELCRQTSSMLSEFNVGNKIIDSKVKELPNPNNYMCYVAMVETLNNRLNEKQIEMNDVGLVIIDEAHFNSFRKLFKFFEKSFLLGVTATPLSSNIKLPLHDTYKELLVGSSISYLIKEGFLAKANNYIYDVGLGSLKIGINGDYTVKSSEILYSTSSMQNKLITAYKENALGKKTLIFNNGINTSYNVYHTFKHAGYDVRHLDNTFSKKQREEILAWFKNKPDAILTSVGLLTTGFDEPTINTIILNRATRSLTLYFQMIGRGSRVLPHKKSFDVIDLGNNIARFGLWSAEIDWQKIFRHPSYFLENMISDIAIERSFRYKMPEELRQKFSKSESVEFNIEEESEKIKNTGSRSFSVIEKAVNQHANICVENSDNFLEALQLFRLLDDDITDRVRRYCYCICKSTKNYRAWVEEEYKKKLKAKIGSKF